MRTFTTYLQNYKDLTKNQDSTNETLGTTLINDSIRTICNLQGGKLRFLEDTSNQYTQAGVETYQIPNKFRKLIDLSIYSGSGGTSNTVYMPEMIFDPTKWKLIQAYRLGTSNVPYFTYVMNKTYSIKPIPATTGNLILLRGRLNVKDLSIADYTTGNIVSIANAGTSIIGSGTVWTADMVGRYIKITETTAVGGGDGMWYEISAYVSATEITLTKPYEGTSIVAGSASYTIGQCSVIPEAYDIAVVYRSCALYWQQQGNLANAKTYWMMYDGGMEAGYRNDYGGIIQQMLDNEGETEEGGYIPPFGTQNNIVSGVPYWYPWQGASGF